MQVATSASCVTSMIARFRSSLRRAIKFRTLSRATISSAAVGSSAIRTSGSCFRKAGIALERSPAAVSRCIADLKDEIGASLFHRHTWGVSLTYAGER
ncbi:MAG: LysR family transcriptional regulator [Anaerolineales bacterium]|nr:LysR family transcriptional regulator [Xanthobacteraceae bacterium]MCW5796313.1 LysR family transcriptional regulator [Nitrospira sp.]MCW5886519.1 LysR family transcriptional regulator [Anaerolineales bacterium]